MRSMLNSQSHAKQEWLSSEWDDLSEGEIRESQEMSSVHIYICIYMYIYMNHMKPTTNQIWTFACSAYRHKFTWSQLPPAIETTKWILTLGPTLVAGGHSLREACCSCSLPSRTPPVGHLWILWYVQHELPEAFYFEAPLSVSSCLGSPGQLRV
jgi:hypothetical protein